MTFSQTLDKATRALMNGIMWCKLKSTWPNTAMKQPKSCTETSSNFFLHDEEFVSRTISDGNVDLDQFPACKVQQLAKIMESSKASAHYIKQVAGDPQAVQINLLKH